MTVTTLLIKFFYAGKNREWTRSSRGNEKPTGYYTEKLDEVHDEVHDDDDDDDDEYEEEDE